MQDNRLDELADKFADDKDNNDFARFMEVLENSQVLVPAQAPENITDEIKKAALSGKPLPVDPANQPKAMLLAKDDGSKVFPIFTSAKQIPPDRKPPAILNMPFQAVIGMLKANADKVNQIAVNPFTKGFVLNENLIDLVDKRYKAGANKQPQGTNVELTLEQMYALAHVKMCREYLPNRLFTDPDDTLTGLKLGKEKYLLGLYKEFYPKNAAFPYTENDFAIMSLQIDDDLIITRVDLPEKHTQEGSPVRLYITEFEGKTGYYMIEKGGKEIPSMIARIGADGSHVKLEEAPDNGAEIEAIMNLLRPS